MSVKIGDSNMSRAFREETPDERLFQVTYHLVSQEKRQLHVRDRERNP